MHWTRTAVIGTAGLITFSLAACSGGPGGSKAANSSNDTGAAQQQRTQQRIMNPSLKAPAPEVKGAKRGGELTIDDNSTPPTMDPSGIYYSDSGAYAAQFLYRSLTQTQTVNGKAVLVPDLATDLGTSSADGKTWTFHIRKGLKYSNGRPVKIEDFVYAIKRSFAKEVAPNGTPYQAEYLVGGSTYKGPFAQPHGKLPGVTTQGDDTLVFHLVKPMPSFAFFASFSEFSPIPQSADTGATYQKHPLTTGPYKVDNFTIGQKMSLSRNPYWRSDTDPVRHQYPDKVQIRFSVSDLTTQQQILSNSGPGATSINIDAVDVSLVDDVRGPKKSQFKSGPSGCSQYVELDTRKIPLSVRKAIAVAYPYSQIRKAAGMSPLSYQPATTFGMLSLPDFKPYPPVNGATGQGTGNPAKAKAMLKAAGKSGFQLSWYYNSDTPSKVAANLAKKNGLEAAGFTVKAIPVSSQEYLNKISEANAPVNMGQGDPGWCFDWPTGDSIYPVLFSGNGMSQGTTVGYFRNAALNKKMDALSRLPIETAAPKWIEIDKELMTKYLPSLPDYYDMSQATFGKKVHNVVLDPGSSLPDFAQAWVG